MRIKQLYLKRYGNFEEKHLDFSQSVNETEDFHMIFGPNETGKSTTREAIHDTLYGVKSSNVTTAAYRVGSPNVRVGATLENSSSELEVVRKTGNRATLLDAQNNAYKDEQATLRPFTQGIGKDEFVRGFSIDHQSLVSGSNEMLDVKSDLGKILFSASSLTFNLNQTAELLQQRAGDIWKPQGRRPLNLNVKRIADLTHSSEQHALKSSSWTALQKDQQRTSEEHEQDNSLLQKVKRECNEMKRIIRTLPLVQKLRNSEERLRDIGDVPVDAHAIAGRVESYKHEITESERQRKDYESQLQYHNRKLQELMPNPTVASASDQIKTLVARYAQNEKAKEDAKSISADISKLSAVLLTDAERLNWHLDSVEDIGVRLPNKDQIDQLYRSQQEQVRLNTEFKRTRDEWKNHEERIQECRKLRDNLSKGFKDHGSLQNFIESSPAWSELERERKTLNERLIQKNGDIELAFFRLQPHIADASDLQQLRVPLTDTISNFSEQFNQSDEEREQLEPNIRFCDQSIKELENKLVQLPDDDETALMDQLKATRARRDTLWSKVQHHVSRSVEQGNIGLTESEWQTLNLELTTAMKQVDEQTDELFECIRKAHKKIQLTEDLARQKRERSGLQSQLDDLQALHSKLQQAWRDSWQGLRSESPPKPSEVHGWLAERDRVQQLLAQKAQIEAEIESLDKREEKIQKEVARELDKLEVGVAPHQIESVREALYFATELIADQKANNQEIERANKDLERLHTAAQQYKQTHDSHQLDLTEWREMWEISLKEANLVIQDPGDAIHTLSNVQTVEMNYRNYQNLRRRLDSIKRDDIQLEIDLQNLAETIGVKYESARQSEFLAKLNSDCEQLTFSQEQREDHQQHVKDFEEKLVVVTSRLQSAEHELEQIRSNLGVQNDEELDLLIQRARDREKLKEQIEDHQEALLEIGDGNSLEELVRACKDVDVATLETRIQELETEELAITERKDKSSYELGYLNSEIKRLRESEDSYSDEVERESVLVETERNVVQFLYNKGQEVTLKVAIEKYREKNQGPIMSRAKELFATMTANNYVDLVSTETKKGEPKLLCVRLDETGNEVQVKLENLSDGTRDQLFLALRLAAIEQLLDNYAMPVIADDLLIKSDDERTRAIFEVLRKLAQKTQVLFFTHHRHLCDIAKNVFGEQLAIHDLSVQS